MENKRVTIVFLVVGLLVMLLVTLSLVGKVSARAETLTPTPSSTITKWGTTTLQPTKRTPTPAEGQSGCPTVAGDLLAGMYNNCKQCFQNLEVYKSSTPTPTGTQATATPTKTSTPTATPTGIWYGYGKPININKVCTYPSACDFGQLNASTYCPGGQIAGIHINSTKSHLWHTLDNSQYWEYTSGSNFFYGYDAPGVYNLSSALFPGQSREPHTTNYRDWVWYKAYPYNGEGSASITINLVVCKNYNAANPTATPTPTAMPCIVNDENTYNLNYGESAGVQRKNDGNEWYWAFGNYDPNVPNGGVLPDTWEKWVHKVLDIQLDVSGVTSVSFNNGTKSPYVAYGAHRISMYDCNDEYLGSYTTSAGTGYTSMGWTIPKTSLCRVVVETINDGNQKLFNSDFLEVNGCKQVHCDSTLFSSTYVFDPTSKFGLLLGGPTGLVHCERIFGGLNFNPIISRVQNILDIPTISTILGNPVLPQLNPVPAVDLCIEAITMPRVVMFGQEMPVGMIILAFVLIGVIQIVRKFLFALGGGGGHE